MKVLLEGNKSISVGGVYGIDYEVEYSNTYRVGDIIDVVLIEHRGGSISKKKINLEVNEDFLNHLKIAHENALEQERLSKFPVEWVCLYKLDLSSRLTDRCNDDISLEELVFDYLLDQECPDDNEDLEDFKDRVFSRIHFLPPEEVKEVVECGLGIGFIDESYRDDLEYELERIENLEEDELDDWDKAYLKLDEERPFDYYVKVIDGDLDNYEEIIVDGFSYSMINYFKCYIIK